jgi:hypothetical protein
VSPQYHVVYDERFTTVAGELTDRVFDSEEWNKLFQLDADENLLDPRDIKHGTEPFPDLFDEFLDSTNPSHPSASQVPGGRGRHERENDVTFEPTPTMMESDPQLDPDTWEIDSIISHRVRRGRVELLVEWVGDYKPTWEPLKYLKEDVPELLYDYGLANKLLNNKLWQWAHEWWNSRQEENSKSNSTSHAKTLCRQIRETRQNILPQHLEHLKLIRELKIEH